MIERLLDLEKYPAALRYTEEEYDLGKFARWLDELGRPQQGQLFIHIAGTKGKGSTAAMLEGIFRAHGFATALFSSPHLEHYGERFRFDGRAWTQQEFEERLKAFDRRLGPEQRRGLDGPVPFRTVFEVLTALALVEFGERARGLDRPQVVLWETGLGGRLDCTNVVEPLVSAITTLGMDHVKILGDTIEKITREKAGIIKPGRPAVLSRQNGCFVTAVHGVVRERAEACGSPLHLAWEETPLIAAEPLEDGQRVRVMLGEEEVEAVLPLAGVFQRANLETALCAAAVAMNRMGTSLRAEGVVAGLRLVNWPGRMEIHRRPQPFVLDGAHCPLSARALAESLGQRGLVPVELLFSMQKDKDAAGFLAAFTATMGPGGVAAIHCYPLGGPRGAAAEDLAAAAAPFAPSYAHGDLPAALAAARASGRTVVAAGTLYTPARVRHLILGEVGNA